MNLSPRKMSKSEGVPHFLLHMDFIINNVIIGCLLKSAESGGNVIQTNAGASLQAEGTSTAGIPQLESTGNE